MREYKVRAAIFVQLSIPTLMISRQHINAIGKFRRNSRILLKRFRN